MQVSIGLFGRHPWHQHHVAQKLVIGQQDGQGLALYSSKCSGEQHPAMLPMRLSLVLKRGTLYSIVTHRELSPQHPAFWCNSPLADW